MISGCSTMAVILNTESIIQPQLFKKQPIKNDWNDSNNLLLYRYYMVLREWNVGMIDSLNYVIVLGKIVLEILFGKKYWEKMFGTFDAQPI